MSLKPNIRSNSRAFTIVELLVVIGIIVALVAIMVPSLVKADRAARKAKCATNLKGIGSGITTYINDSSLRTYPVTNNWYQLLGKRGRITGYDQPVARPLNPYLGITGSDPGDVEIARCPDDSGGESVVPILLKVPDEELDPGDPDPGAIIPTIEGWGPSDSVYDDVGSSYIDAFLTRTGIEGVFASTEAGGGGPTRLADIRPAGSKILLGDAPIYGDNKYGKGNDPRNRWHSQNPRIRQFNVLFASGHVEYYLFEAGDDGIAHIEKMNDEEETVEPSNGFW